MRTARPGPASRVGSRIVSCTVRWVARYPAKAKRASFDRFSMGPRPRVTDGGHYMAGDPSRCGTLHDHQPVELAVMSHTRVWMPAHEPESGEDPAWLPRLRTAREHETFVGAAERGGLAEVVRVAEQAPDDPEVQARVLELLAKVEASRVAQRGRY